MTLGFNLSNSVAWVMEVVAMTAWGCSRDKNRALNNNCTPSPVLTAL